MKKITNVFVALIFVLLGVGNVSATGWESEYEGVMLQGFYWDSFEDTKWTNLTAQVDELSAYYDLIWVPNSASSGYSSMGYNPKYWFQHESAFGTSGELRKMIKEFKKKGTGFIADVVINHRDGVNSWCDFPEETDHHGRTWQLGTWAICGNDEMAYADGQPKPTGAYDEGENFDGCRDLDHTNSYVQDAVKAYLDYLLNELGYAGFRYDMVKGFAAYYVGLYNATVKPTYSVGEYFDGDYGMVTGWIDGTKRDNEIQSGAFDFPMKFRMNEAFANPSDFSILATQYNSVNQPNGLLKEPGFRRFAVTFVDNHDTYGRNNGQELNSYYALAANAFILCHPGTPCVFLPHWKAYKNEIKQLINVRKSVGIHNQSHVEVWVAQKDKYVAKVFGKHGDLFIKVGYGDYTPDGFNSNDIVASGEGYCVWSKVHIKNMDDKIIPSNDGNGFSVYLEKSSLPASWKDVYCYAWVDETKRLTRTFPGENVYKEVVVGGDVYYKFSFDATTAKANLLFSNGNGSQTVDIAAVQGNTYYRIQSTNSSGKYTVQTLNVSGDETGEPITISLAKNSVPASWGTVKFYAWDKNDNKLLGSWSGAEINATTTIAGREYYTYTFPNTVTMVNLIFTDGSKQTVDIKGVDRTTYYAITELDGDKYEVEELNVPGNGGISVYFESNTVSAGWSNINCYAWDNDDNKLLGEWPGTAMTDTVFLYGRTYFVATFDRDVKSVNVIFNNGTGQTADIENIDCDTYFSIKSDYNYYRGTGAIFVCLDANSAADWDKVYYYAWDADKNALLGEWPGMQITTTMRVANNKEYYFCPFAPHMPLINVVFNDGTNKNQTVDIENITESSFYVLNGTTGKSIAVSTDDTYIGTGIEDVTLPADACVVYPNPCVDYLYISDTMNVDAVQVYNIEGRVVLQSRETVLDVHALSPGIYFYNILHSDGMVSRGKFVKR